MPGERSTRLQVNTIRAFLALCLAVGAPAAAATVKGIVLNRTTGKPAGGDKVNVMFMDGGMIEIGRGLTDSAALKTDGALTFSSSDKNMQDFLNHLCARCRLQFSFCSFP